MFIPAALGFIINVNNHSGFTDTKSFGALIVLLALAVIEDCIKTYRGELKDEYRMDTKSSRNN